MAIKYRNFSYFGVIQASLIVLSWHTLCEYFFVPGSLWSRYIWRAQAIDLSQLQKDWELLLAQGEPQPVFQHLQGSLTPIEIFYQNDLQKGERCWAKGAGNFNAKEWLSVIGPKGIIGHAQYQSYGFYKIQAIQHKGSHLSATVPTKNGIFFLQGDGYLLSGVDRDRVLDVGDRFVTLACDPYYPALYPIAEIISVQYDSEDKVIKFKARPLQPLEQTSYAMIYQKQVNLESNHAVA